MRLTVWLTVGPLWCRRSAMRARSGATPSSSSSRMVRRYISVVSTRSFNVPPSRVAMLLDIAYGTLERVTTTTEPSMEPTATGPLISARELQRVLGTPDSYHDGPTVLDVRWRLGAPSARPDYLAGHLPGAAFLELDEDICGHAAGPGGRHPLPDPARLRDALRA